jgi:hypothetical protein
MTTAPSSTSSSSGRPAELARVGCLILLLSAGVEIGWRSRGFTPMPADDVYHWCFERRRVGKSPDVLVLAGSSRFHCGLSVAEFERAASARPVIQLSVSGGNPLSLLADLAQDPEFRGTVLCEVIPHLYFTNIGPWSLWPGLEHRPFSSPGEDWLRVHASRHLALLRPELKLGRVGQGLWEKAEFPSAGPQKITRSRELLADFSQVDVEESMRTQAAAYEKTGKTLDAGALAQRISWIRQQVDQIQRRGGRVVFFRMLSSGRILEIEDLRFPDAEYWGAFVRGCGAPAIHFRDLPALDAFRCPEGSHLDRQDAAPFTRVLTLELRRRSLL